MFRKPLGLPLAPEGMHHFFLFYSLPPPPLTFWKHKETVGRDGKTRVRVLSSLLRGLVPVPSPWSSLFFWPLAGREEASGQGIQAPPEQGPQAQQ